MFGRLASVVAKQLLQGQHVVRMLVRSSTDAMGRERAGGAEGIQRRRAGDASDSSRW